MLRPLLRRAHGLDIKAPRPPPTKSLFQPPRSSQNSYPHCIPFVTFLQPTAHDSHFAMDDDELFSMFTDDDALLPGPPFLTPGNDNAALNLIHVPRLEVDDYGYAPLPDPGSVRGLPLDGTLLLETLPIQGHDTFPRGQPLPLSVDEDTTQVLAMVQIPLAEGFDGHLHQPSTSFDHLDLLGLSTTQPSAVVPAGAPHPFIATIPPPNALGWLQAPTQEEVTGRERAFGAPKRPFNQPESPRRPEKRLCSIRPKLFSAQASVTGNTNTSSTTPSAPPKPDVKEGNVPASMLGTFRLESSETSACSDKRTRSKRVCLKCQSLRKKVCDPVSMQRRQTWLGTFLTNREAVRWHLPLSTLPRPRQGTWTQAPPIQRTPLLRRQPRGS